VNGWSADLLGYVWTAAVAADDARLPTLVLSSAFAATACGVAAFAAALRYQLRRYRERFALGVDAGLQQAYVFVDVRRLYRLNLAAVALLAAGTYALTSQPVAVLLVLAAAGATPSVVVTVLKRRRIDRFTRQFPDALMLIAGGLRAGSSLPQAIAQAASELPPPSAQELVMVAREQRLGVPVDGSMANLERRVPVSEVALFAAAVRVAQESGGNLAETLERLSDTLRRKLAVEGKIDALTSQGRLQGWVMALLPLGIAVALFVIEPIAMRPLVTTWYGWAVCAGVAALELAGLHFIRKIVNIDV
jgi:tight adherence protein B